MVSGFAGCGGRPLCAGVEVVGAQYLQLETTKFGRVLVRETITMTVGTSNDDLVRNLVRMIFEERIGLAVERPAALLAITGL